MFITIHSGPGSTLKDELPWNFCFYWGVERKQENRHWQHRVIAMKTVKAHSGNLNQFGDGSGIEVIREGFLEEVMSEGTPEEQCGMAGGWKEAFRLKVSTTMLSLCCESFEGNGRVLISSTK